MNSAVATGRRTLQLEGEAVLAAATRLDDRFGDAVDLLAQGGRVVVSGIGKSGVIAQKIAATLTSTGTAATYLHPIESLHGDLGVVDASTVAIVLSKSGETEELFGLLDALGRMLIPIIAITGESASTLGRAARVTLDAAVSEEACPHGLAPTTSTTVSLALGDALAVALLERKGFRREDFATLHPGGRLGRKLLLRVRDVMVLASHALPSTATMQQAVVGLARGRGLVPLIDGGQLVGVITTGDLTRLVERTSDYLTMPVADVMSRSPRSSQADDLAATALGAMERYGVVALPVLETDGHVIGVVHLHDLLRAGAA